MSDLHLSEKTRQYQHKIFGALGLMFVQLLLLSGAFVFGYLSQKKLEKLSENRYQSFLIGDGLRQSSDDLTRMVRTYASTQDKKYQRQFYHILAIRQGQAPRPQNYHRIYLDIISADSTWSSGTSTERVSLYDMMRQAGFSETEFALLELSESYSNALVDMEEEAMNALDGKFKDIQGNYTITKPADKEYAMRLLFGQEYHQAKKNIMLPINEFFESFERRTKSEVDSQEKLVVGIIFLLITLVGSMVLNVTFIFRQGKLLQQFMVSELEKTVKKQTEEILLQNEALNRTKKEIEQKNRLLQYNNEELEQYAYITSHDLQEPLRKIKNFSELLSKQCVSSIDDKGEKYLRYIIDGAARMQNLINDLLAYSRVTTKGKIFESIPMEMAAKTAIDNLSLLIHETGAKVTVNRLPEARADELQITQLFQNLISNALKYRKTDVVPEITISCERENGHCVYSIADNGIGFEMQYSERIFQVFQRLHTLGEYEGTGIGLSICKRIVNRHGGRIWAKSEPGKGTVFSFTIAEFEAETSPSEA